MDGARERLGRLAALDSTLCPAAHGERVLDDHARVGVVERIHQTSSLPSASSGSPSASMRPPRAQVADQVPVDRRLVLAAEQRERAAEREVARAADLLVEERVADGALHHLVRADRELADAARALVGVDARDQLLLAERGRRVDDDAGLEAQAHVAVGAAVLQRRHVEQDLALDAALRRTAEDLAVGQVRLARARLPRTALDVDAQIGAGRDDVQLAHAREPVDQPLVALAERAPGGDRVGLVEQQRRVDELLPGRRCPCARSARPAPSDTRRRPSSSSPAASRSSWRAIQGARARASAASRTLATPARSDVLPAPTRTASGRSARRSRARRGRGRRPARRCRCAARRRAPIPAPSPRSRARRGARPRAPSRPRAAAPAGGVEISRLCDSSMPSECSQISCA